MRRLSAWMMRNFAPPTRARTLVLTGRCLGVAAMALPLQGLHGPSARPMVEVCSGGAVRTIPLPGGEDEPVGGGCHAPGLCEKRRKPGRLPGIG